jgi:hypothetical protein
MVPQKTPGESMAFNLVVDATDQLEHPQSNPDAVGQGVYPQLSAIEMLLYPRKASRTVGNLLCRLFPNAMKKQPLTLFVWGRKRVLPVRITELRITEEMFDRRLNPIRATIAVTMHVLNDTDGGHHEKGIEYWQSHLAEKIGLAEKAFAENTVGDLNTR